MLLLELSESHYHARPRTAASEQLRNLASNPARRLLWETEKETFLLDFSIRKVPNTGIPRRERPSLSLFVTMEERCTTTFPPPALDLSARRTAILDLIEDLGESTVHGWAFSVEALIFLDGFAKEA